MIAASALLRLLPFLTLGFGTLALLLFALEFDLVATGGPTRSYKQELHLKEMILLGGFSTLGVALIAFINRFLMFRERALRAVAERDASTDPLTGLSNRRRFLRRAEQELARALSDRGECALLLMDLDGFKPVNDLHGHAAGDAVLVEVARRLCDCFPHAADVARLGGDEFGVLLKGHAATTMVARAAIGQFLNALELPIRHAGSELRISASVGVAFGPAREADVTKLLAAADEQMYEYKRDRRGSIGRRSGP